MVFAISNFHRLGDKMVRWLAKVLKPQSGRRGSTTFRWSLPLTQLVVCGLVLWPLRAELISQARQCFDAYKSGKDLEPPTRFRPANLSEEEYQQEQVEEV